MVRKSLTCLLLLAFWGAVHAQVTTDSPFMPSGSAAPSAATATSAEGVEFCGVTQRDGELWFALYETGAGKGRWIPLGRASDGWLAQNYDSARRELTLSLNGQTQVLALRQPKLDGSGATASASLPPGVVPPVMAPTAADEAARLKSVADEIKRRRALRAAALNGQNAGTPPPPPSGQPAGSAPPPPPPAP